MVVVEKSKISKICKSSRSLSWTFETPHCSFTFLQPPKSTHDCHSLIKTKGRPQGQVYIHTAAFCVFCSCVSTNVFLSDLTQINYYLSHKLRAKTLHLITNTI